MDKPTELLPVDPRLVHIQSDVREHFDWNSSEDLSSARDLLEQVESYDIRPWERPQRTANVATVYRRLVLRETEVAILGAAVEPEEVEEILQRPSLLVAADGAAGVFSMLPGSTAERAWSRLICIVSDADGGEGTYEAVERSKPIFLHAHGDNRTDWEALLDYASRVATPPPLILTHQTNSPIEGMSNPGGFTDGDRAACIVRSIGVPLESISMLGTRTDVVGRWSGITDEKAKLEKLKWMREVLKILEIGF
ncbi:MAG: hypothetical protein CMA96_04050 [Euryarchaeota archaeon]|jgi:uncharacterized Rossmann fold enzyme|nr:hypothetical protein [Euryarchaeota archaeon]DAC38111.1 MAG TPA: hypothetical protein D7H75_02230 [Candidatus Poseidoniales archaeon]HIH56054.1 hypothetical protein [Candidatus Thalassarchaeum sp.]|tara:strand:- start:104 stop:859 length:756 start_codon:yes stop_codon:yes gene_type:complete